MYDWRRMTQEECNEVLRERKLRHAPWHRPPVWNVSGEQIYLITAACFEHAPIIGKSHDRLVQCECAIFDACKQTAVRALAGLAVLKCDRIFESDGSRSGVGDLERIPIEKLRQGLG